MGAFDGWTTAIASVLILCDSDISSSPRVLLEIEALLPAYDLTVAGYSFSDAGEFSNVQFIELPRQSSPKRTLWERARGAVAARLKRVEKIVRPNSHLARKSRRAETKAWLALLRDVHADALIVHHARNLPLARQLADDKRIPIIFNAHEYYPREFEGNIWWDENVKDVADFVTRRFLPQVDVVFAVSKPIADEYKKQFGVDARVLMSTKPFHDLAPSTVDRDNVRIIHHGIANPDRHLESMIDLVDLLDPRYTIDFMLVPSPDHSDYFAGLARRIEAHPRLRLLPPVPTKRIITETRQYDIGLFLLAPTNFNLQNALPNKFFEYVQARLCVAFSPVPAVADLIREYNLGVVSPDFSVRAMASSLNALSAEEIGAYKNAADSAARSLSSDRSYTILRDAVAGIVRADSRNA